MKLTDLFVRRPVLAIVVNLVILLAGYQSIRSLNVRQYPRSDLSVVSIKTVYVGANADLVRGFLTTTAGAPWRKGTSGAFGTADLSLAAGDTVQVELPSDALVVLPP